MSESTIALLTSFKLTSCAQCGIAFGLPASYDTELRNDHQTFWCPNGHQLNYNGPSEAEKLKLELVKVNRLAAAEKERLERQLDNARGDEALERSARKHYEHKANGMKGALSRVKRRVAEGRCPCCSHQFKDLEHHMKNRHPKWSPESHADAIVAHAASQELAGAVK